MCHSDPLAPLTAPRLPRLLESSVGCGLPVSSDSSRSGQRQRLSRQFEGHGRECVASGVSGWGVLCFCLPWWNHWRLCVRVCVRERDREGFFWGGERERKQGKKGERASTYTCTHGEVWGHTGNTQRHTGTQRHTRRPGRRAQPPAAPNSDL